MWANKLRPVIEQYGILYLAGFILVLGMKWFFGNADSHELNWILAPTARWVTALSGIYFEKEPHIGFVNHYYRFIIAPSCSGVQFMLITTATLIFSFVHRMGGLGRGICWMGVSLGVSYFLTILVNGFRIILSIYLPAYFHRSGLYSQWLTDERLHTVIGTAVYFGSLLAIYPVAEIVAKKIARRHERAVRFNADGPKYILPVSCYFTLALAVPILNRAYENNLEKFAEYAVTITAVCLGLMFLLSAISTIRKHLKHIKTLN